MIPYREWRPTGFDPAGLPFEVDGESREDWLVGPVGRNRDSGVLGECNWSVVLKRLGELASAGEDPDFEVHRFGHWACGWFEVILVRPGSLAANEAEAFENALADYPIASESAFSEAEWEAAAESWRTMREKDRIEEMRKHPRDWKFESFAELLGTIRRHGKEAKHVPFNGYQGDNLARIYGES